jgi:hypothetical protein
LATLIIGGGEKPAARDFVALAFPAGLAARLDRGMISSIRYFRVRSRAV